MSNPITKEELPDDDLRNYFNSVEPLTEADIKELEAYETRKAFSLGGDKYIILHIVTGGVEILHGSLLPDEAEYGIYLMQDQKDAMLKHLAPEREKALREALEKVSNDLRWLLNGYDDNKSAVENSQAAYDAKCTAIAILSDIKEALKP